MLTIPFDAEVLRIQVDLMEAALDAQDELSKGPGISPAVLANVSKLRAITVRNIENMQAILASYDASAPEAETQALLDKFVLEHREGLSIIERMSDDGLSTPQALA